MNSDIPSDDERDEQNASEMPVNDEVFLTIENSYYRLSIDNHLQILSLFRIWRREEEVVRKGAEPLIKHWLPPTPPTARLQLGLVSIVQIMPHPRLSILIALTSIGYLIIRGTCKLLVNVDPRHSSLDSTLYYCTY